MNRRWWVLVTVALTMSTAMADEWPSRPVRMVSTFAAGGTADVLTRLVAEHLTAAFKQQFFVETRAGAGGAIGVQSVAHSPPDGYNFALTNITHLVLLLLTLWWLWPPRLPGMAGLMADSAHRYVFGSRGSGAGHAAGGGRGGETDGLQPAQVSHPEVQQGADLPRETERTPDQPIAPPVVTTNAPRGSDTDAAAPHAPSTRASRRPWKGRAESDAPRTSNCGVLKIL